MKETVKEGRLNALFGKALLLFAAAFVMLCSNPRIAHAAYVNFPMGSEADGYYIDADGNMTIYTEEGLDSWLNDIEGAPPTYKQKVKTLTVNEGVTVIKNFSDSMYDIPFSDYCDNLTTVRLPASLTEIGDKVFNGCDKLTTVTIAEPSSLTMIGASAFEMDTSLTTINIPGSVTTIGSGAFKDCRALELDAATLPSGLTAINDSIFASCWKMTGSLTIPDGVTSIGESAFYYCYKLKSVTIPASVTSIGASAFERCDMLYSVTMQGETPPTLGDGSGSDNVFKDTVISTIDKSIYVPKSSIATYKASWTQWRDYINDAGSVDSPTEDYADTDIDVQGFTEDATVYSVDVEWGAMTFQWENSSWDPKTHMKKTGAGWKVYDSTKDKALDVTESAINEVKVTNHSNAAVWATLSYASEADYDPDTTGEFSFTKGTEDTDTDKLTAASGSVPAYLSLATADNNQGEAEGQGKETVGKAYFKPAGLATSLQTDKGIKKWSQLGTITVGIVTEEP